ncbi:MAG: AMP-binding protein, partial [Myxococcota bacterium]
HHNILSNLQALRPIVHDVFAAQSSIRLISFLSLSHAFERTLGHFMALDQGFELAFSRGINFLTQDFVELQPDFMISVPSIYERLFAELRCSFSKQNPWRQRIFDWCVNVAQEYAHYLLSQQKPGIVFEHTKLAIANQILFQPLRHQLGGRLKIAISGSAPLSPKLLEFFLGAGIPIVEGYGLTEASPVLTVNPPHAIRPGTVGLPLHNVELKIAPQPEENGHGEILARGPNIMLGYLNQPLETQQALSQEGWLHTGDIGYFDSDGYLILTARRKALLKLNNGKYVAPEPLERYLQAHPLIQQAVLLGDRRHACLALIVPDLQALRNEFPTLPLHTTQALQHPSIQERFREIFEEMHHTLDLARWEHIHTWRLLPIPFSQQHDELTPTGKPKRQTIERNHAPLDEDR